MANKQLPSAQEFRERFELFFDVEQNAIKQLLDELDRLQALNKEVYEDYIREKIVGRSQQEELRELKTKAERRLFAVLLIDADSDDYLFQGRFLNSGLEGGKHAADELHASVIDYLQSINIDTEGLRVVVRAFASFGGLQTACVKKGLLKPEISVSAFAQGFTKRRGLFDFIDVGPGKEEADSKIKDSLDLFVSDYQCKHIILGACQDAGYAPFLRNFASDSTKRNKFSLLVGNMMHASFKDIGFPRKPLKMEKVFAFQSASNNSSSVTNDLSANTGPWKAVSQSLAHKQPQLLVNEKAKEFADKLKPIRDSNGKRVDKKLKVDPNSDYIKVMKMANFCGYYYLRGQCDGTCHRNHILPSLNSHEFDCLWSILRQAYCFKTRKGKDCEDPLCFYGHQSSPQ